SFRTLLACGVIDCFAVLLPVPPPRLAGGFVAGAVALPLLIFRETDRLLLASLSFGCAHFRERFNTLPLLDFFQPRRLTIGKDRPAIGHLVVFFEVPNFACVHIHFISSFPPRAR